MTQMKLFSNFAEENFDICFLAFKENKVVSPGFVESSSSHGSVFAYDIFENITACP